MTYYLTIEVFLLSIFSLTKLYEEEREKWRAKQDHHFPQTSDDGTPQCLAWLVGLKRVTGHNINFL